MRRTLKKLSCDVCRGSLVTDAASASKDQSYHLLTLKNNGGLVIPSEGTLRIIRAAEWVIRQASLSFEAHQTAGGPIHCEEEDWDRGRVWARGTH